MIRKLTGITPPKDTDFLWRYMSFEKFVSILDTKTYSLQAPISLTILLKALHLHQ